MPTHKEIQKLKIALTTDCVLVCRHCNIDKSASLTIPFEHAQKGVQLLLEAHGRQKRLELYGGEPLLKFDLMRNIVEYAITYAVDKNKLLSISVATNGLLINKEIVDFLKKFRINLSVSVSGSEDVHNSCRVYADGRGSWSILEPKLTFMLQELNPYDIVALECIAPTGAENLYADLQTLVQKGFRVINVECVHGMEWSEQHLQNLVYNLNNFSKFLFSEIRRQNFIIPEPFIEFFRVGGADTPIFCPMYRDLEMYPDGILSFYPFAFLNYKESKDKVKIGSASLGFIEKYQTCKQNSDEKMCKDCVSDYYRIPGLSSGAEAYSLRTSIMKKIFLEIMRMSRKEKVFAEYVKFLALYKNKQYVDYSRGSI